MSDLKTELIDLADKGFELNTSISATDLLRAIDKYPEPSVIKYWCRNGHVVGGIAAKKHLSHSIVSGEPPKCSICRNKLYRVGVDIKKAISDNEKRKKTYGDKNG